MIKKLVVKLAGATAKALHGIRLTKNETINVGGYKYPVAEFMGYSDSKITSILKAAGADSEQIRLTFEWLESMGRNSQR